MFISRRRFCQLWISVQCAFYIRQTKLIFISCNIYLLWKFLCCGRNIELLPMTPHHVRVFMHIMHAWHSSNALCHKSHVKIYYFHKRHISNKVSAKINTMNIFYVPRYYILLWKCYCKNNSAIWNFSNLKRNFYSV